MFQILNHIEFEVYGDYALFADPLTKLGGDRCSYPVPTYESLMHIAEKIYWKPTFRWVIDKVRVINPISLSAKGKMQHKQHVKDSANPYDFLNYCYLTDVRYQVHAHFEWNLHSPFENDRNMQKHSAIANRCLTRGNPYKVPFLGLPECPACIKECTFGEGTGYYDNADEVDMGMMFFCFYRPEDTGTENFEKAFLHIKMKNGVIEFPHPDSILPEDRIFVRKQKPYIYINKGETDLGEE